MGNSSSASNIKVVIVGAGYGGTTAAMALDSQCQVTLIEPQDTMHHKIASVRGAIVPGWEKRTRVPLDKVLKNGKIIQAEVASVTTGAVNLKDGTVINADYIILAHGVGFGTFPCGFAESFTNATEYQQKLVQKQSIIAAAKSILIVGGGPTGLEFAGEIAAQHPGKKITIVHAGETLLSNSGKPVIPKALVKIADRLKLLGVKDIHLNTRVSNLPELKDGDAFISTPQPVDYALSNGTSVQADLAIICTGGGRRAGNLVTAVDDQNRVRVQQDLLVEGLDKVYCIGDANNVAETKLAYFAGNQAGIAVKNILHQVAGQPTEPYTPMDGQKEYGIFLIPMGPNIGVTAMGNVVMGNYMSSLFKSKGLMVNKMFTSRNAVVPDL